MGSGGEEGGEEREGKEKRPRAGPTQMEFQTRSRAGPKQNLKKTIRWVKVTHRQSERLVT